MKILSVCIPTRNRQDYAKHAVNIILQTSRLDIEIILADNSDNAEYIFETLKEVVSDSRLKILKSSNKPLTMRENWERALDHCTGEWISFIGDDDALIPEVAELLDIYKGRLHEADVLMWEPILYRWPELARSDEILTFSTKYSIGVIKTAELLDLALSWRGPGGGISCCSIYHGCHKRSLVEKIKKQNGRYFSYETVDYGSGYQTAINVSYVAISERPWSIMGSGEKSNSAGKVSREVLRKRVHEWASVGGTYDGIQLSPIPPEFSTPAVILAFQYQFTYDNDIKFEPHWPSVARIFVNDLVVSCKTNQEIAEHWHILIDYLDKHPLKDELIKIGLPSLDFIPALPDFCGYGDGFFYIPYSVLNLKNTFECIKILRGLLCPVKYVGLNLTFKRLVNGKGND